MVLAEIAAGVAGTASTTAYTIGNKNRAAWGKDVKIKQGQRFHQHKLLVMQARMFREDVRDLIRTANNQQHNFIVVGTLILGYSFRLLTSKMPIRAPQFMDKLYFLCSSIAFLYLLLAVLCALCSIQLSMKCERDMLTGTVRLPIEDMIGEVQETGWESTMEGFEHQNLATVLRIPGLGRLTGRKPKDHLLPSSMGKDLGPPAAEGLSPATSMAASATASSAGGAPAGFNYVSVEYLRERCKEYRREFYVKEGEWTGISRYSPFFILWGMEHLLYAMAYSHVSEYYADGQTDGFIRQGFFISIALLVSIVYNTYTNRTLARMSPAWIIVDFTAILLAAFLCAFANMYRGGLLGTGLAIEALYLCHLVKHLCQALKLQVAFRKREKQDALEGEGEMEPSLGQGGRGASVPAVDAVYSATTSAGAPVAKPSSTNQLNWAIKTAIIASAFIVCSSWAGAGIHDLHCGPLAWRGCELDPLNPNSLANCYRGPHRDNSPGPGERRLEAPGTDEDDREQEVEEEEEEADEAVPSADEEMILVALNVAGERRLFRHMGSTLAGEVVKLHPCASQKLRGSSTIADRHGVELGENVPLRAAAHDKDALVEGVLDLFIEGGA